MELGKGLRRVNARGQTDGMAVAPTLGFAGTTLQVRVRRSPRARRLILRVLSADTVEVVLPPDATRAQVAPFLARHADWIRGAQARLAARPEDRERGMPSVVHLPAVRERWEVRSLWTFDAEVHVCEYPASQRLELRGSIDRLELWTSALQRWLQRRAQELLVPWLCRLADRLGFLHGGVTVRLQRSRWGSCSSRGRLNLNARLLLVAPELVEYLFVHELCHIRQLNHSARFWNLVGSHCPEYRTLDERLNRAGRELPFWSRFRTL